MKSSDPSHATRHRSAGTDEAGWSRALGELALACAGSFPAEEAQHLRELRRLLALAPEQAEARGLLVPSAERLDRMIAAEAGASAVLMVLGRECGYLISRGGGGQHLASIILPGMAEETSASGDTLALALAGAIAMALAEALSEPVERRSAARPARLN